MRTQARCMICVYFLNEGLTVVQTNPQLATILGAEAPQPGRPASSAPACTSFPAGAAAPLSPLSEVVASPQAANVVAVRAASICICVGVHSWHPCTYSHPDPNECMSTKRYSGTHICVSLRDTQASILSATHLFNGDGVWQELTAAALQCPASNTNSAGSPAILRFTR